MNKQKGVSIISELILSIGIIGVAILFSLVATDVIDFSRASFTSSAQSGMLEDISFRISTIQGSAGESQFTYTPTFSQYTLEIRDNHTLEIQLEGEETQTATFHAVRLQENYIEGSEQLCIHGNAQEIAIKAGNCSTTDLSEICADGCDLQACDPELGADCTTPVCTYPEDAESPDATANCAPGYDPDYISKDNSIVGIGWVNQTFVDHQGEEDRCEESFECGVSASGENLECRQAGPDAGTNDKFCCPEGEQYNGTACAEPDVIYDFVFVPARYSSESAFESDAEDTYNYLVSRSPFDECTAPESRFNKTMISPNDCDIDACDMSPAGSCTNNCHPSTAAQCYNQMEQCANAEVGAGNWDKIVGLADGEGPIISTPSGSGMICGKAKNIPADISVSYNECNTDTASHEVGHTFGLFHIDATGNEAGACQGPNQPDCSEPNKNQFLMSYATARDQFGPTAQSHLGNDVSILEEVISAC